jgi:hypothetical protein
MNTSTVVDFDLKCHLNFFCYLLQLYFSFPALDQEINTGIKLFGMEVVLVTNAELKEGVVSMTAKVKLCNGLFATCLPPLDLFNEIKFGLETSCKKKSC